MYGLHAKTGLLSLALLVSTANVARGDFSASGRLEGASPVQDLSFSESGVILEMTANEGELVTEGEVLARIECTPQQHAVAEAEAALSIARRGPRKEEVAVAESELTVAERELSLAQAKVRRLGPLVKDELASEGDLEDAELAVRVAEARVERAQRSLALVDQPLPREEVELANARLQQARATVSRCTMLAPHDGVVLRRILEPGAAVSSFVPEPVYSFSRTGQWRVRAEVDEADVGKLSLGQTVRVYAEAFGADPVQGTVANLPAEMGRRAILSGDPGEKMDRDVAEVLIDLATEPSTPIVGLRVRVIFIEDD